MNIIELMLLSVGLAMDAFSVAVCQGLSMKKMSVRSGLIIALFFGVFQGGMPLIGYFLGNSFAGYINSVSHWIAFILLGIIGGKMIWETYHEEEDHGEKGEYKLALGALTVLAVATSIDALAVGIVFAAADVNLILSVIMIATVTFVISFAGVVIGHKFGSRFEKKAEIAGGVVLILIGVKMLMDGLGII